MHPNPCKNHAEPNNQRNVNDPSRKWGMTVIKLEIAKMTIANCTTHLHPNFTKKYPVKGAPINSLTPNTASSIPT